MSYEFLKCEEQEKVATMTLNRPDKRNALSIAMREEIMHCLGELEKTKAVQVVILTGAGSSFCAGFDLKEFTDGDVEKILTQAETYHQKVYNFPKPLIAAVNGPALAGGMDLAAMCDVRIASEEAFFGQPQVRMGILANYELIRTVIPEGAARELCLTGRRIDAEEALSLGLVSRIVHREKLMEEVLSLAKEVAGNRATQIIKGQFIKEQPRMFET